jgi:P pilus assembly chaperone PapD
MKLKSIKCTFKTMLAAGLAVASLTAATLAQASIVLNGTRVIYNADVSEVTVKLGNQGQSPALAQAWIDNGDPKAAPSTIATPFTVTPPVSRIDPGKAQTLRIFYMGDALPKDRESVFYLNVLEIPPKPAADEASPNRLQLAFRTRIKLFFRPTGLKMAVADASKQLTWRWSHESGKPGLTVTNPTPYYITLASFEVKDSTGAVLAKSMDSAMIEPGQSKLMPVTEQVQRPGEIVRFHSINDYGGEDEGEAHVQ